MASNHAAKKTDTGDYEYRGYRISKITDRRDAYNPWTMSLGKRSFRTLAAAKQFIDARLEAKGAQVEEVQ